MLYQKEQHLLIFILGIFGIGTLEFVRMSIFVYKYNNPTSQKTWTEHKLCNNDDRNYDKHGFCVMV